MAEFKMPEWIRDHMARYLASDGEDGHMWQGLPSLLLTAKGRKSGELHTLPLVYGKTAEGYVLVASKGGAPTHPVWYLNLQANPDVQIQVGADKYMATAATVSGKQREKLWTLMTDIFPGYNEYQTKTDREIPVVLLTLD